MTRLRRIDTARIFPSAHALWQAAADSPWRCWLESGGPASIGRYTALGWGTPRWILSGNAHGMELVTQGGVKRRLKRKDPIAVLRQLVEQSSFPTGDLFSQGGAFGFWGYESARHFENSFAASMAPGDLPEFLWILPRFWAIWDREKKSFALLEQATPGEKSELELWRERLKKLPRETAGPEKKSSGARVAPRWERNRVWYEQGVRKIKKFIAAGDIYQANLTHRLDFPWPSDKEPVDLFTALREVNPSPYSFLLQGSDFSLVSCSPELLLRAEGDRVETRPIAGTRPRGKTSLEDRRLSGELLLHPKERAEHVMLLDLERNDLGRVCRPGSVEVSERLVLERYSHVAHIVSHVRGRLRRGLDGLDATRAVFPGGTITGCPKIRCMEILREIEAEPRGPFFGGAGWIGPSGDTVLNIMIRTAMIRRGRLSLRVGAGIVVDSDPAREYDETLQKAAALITAFQKIGGKIR